MLLLLDTVDIEEIRKSFDVYPLDGVTCNPAIASKYKGGLIQLLGDIRKIIGLDRMLHIQVLGITALEMEEEAVYLRKEIGGNLYIKIPVTPEGIKAISTLKGRDFKITATTIFTAVQAIIAAKAGADYVAPYLNRLDNIAGDSIKVVSDIVNICGMNGLNSKVIAASFGNVEQVHKALIAGADGVTVSPNFINQLVSHPLTNWSINKFTEEWESAFGKGKRINNLL